MPRSSSDRVRWASAVSHHPVAPSAVGEVAGSVLDQVGTQPDAAVVLATPHFRGALPDIVAAIRTILGPRSLIGGTVASLGEHGLEHGVGIGVLALRWSTSDAAAAPPAVALAAAEGGWRSASGQQVDPDPDGTLLALADPMGAPVASFAVRVGQGALQLPMAGGLLWGGDALAPVAMVADDVHVERGAVGLLLPPAAGLRIVAAPNGRPLGGWRSVTAAAGAMLVELDGRPARDGLRAALRTLGPTDRPNVARWLRLELEVPGLPGRTTVPVLGQDRRTGSLALGAPIPDGAAARFALGDAAGAAQALRGSLRHQGLETGIAFVPVHDDARGDADDERLLALADHVHRGRALVVGCPASIGPSPDGHLVHEMAPVVLGCGPRP